ncbi:MAG: hypothetical protein JNG84_02860, partial [Archangium sp.]|nr:hypothetical protein [Archangium sp.]
MMRLAYVAMVVLVGCGPEGTSSSSIAVAADFQDFDSWESIRLGDEVDGGIVDGGIVASDGGVIHGAGVRTVYINR